MATQEIQLAEVAGWRASLTEAQHLARIYLDRAIEDYVVRLLFQAIGQPTGQLAHDAAEFIERLARQRSNTARGLLAVADECLIFGGLFPEQAIARGIPVTYFVHLGMNAYREYATQQREVDTRAFFTNLAENFVAIVDVLHTLRELQQDAPCIDALNAYQLWREMGSSHAWQVLRQLTSGTPSHHSNHSTH